LNFTTALADWLEPYHDHIRPPHPTLIEAAKQAEAKGHAAKGVRPSPQNGTNGDPKREEEPPVAKVPPLIVTDFFEGTIDDIPWNE
jgi:N-terminal acetyltransferase B complex non-catalytic subunit